MHALRVLPVCLLLATSHLAGQGAISATVTPNPAPPGTPVNILVTDASGQGLTFHSSCVVREVRAGTPTGPTVFTPSCLITIITLFPGQTIGDTWNQQDNAGVQVPDGTYWLKVRYTSAGTMTDEWFSVEITGDPAFPSLTVTPGSGAVIGQTLSLDLSAPGAAGNPYVAAVALTTNQGQSAGSLFVHLDPDFLFSLSITDPANPLFNNLQGLLDGTGSATGIGLNLPNAPALQRLPLHVQALVQAAATGFQLTNTVHLTIQ